MYSTLSVHCLPTLTTAEELAAGVVVLVDVLRASTTIIAALANGARQIVPCMEVEEARERVAVLAAEAHAPLHPAGPDDASSATLQQPQLPLLGGERGGLPIAGFDLGNSPCDYTPEAVRHRTIVFTTTNGTRALGICTAASRVLIGSFVNFSAVMAQLNGDKPIHLLCAGTRDRITREDVLFAGAIVERLTTGAIAETEVNDEARIARDVWQQAMGSIRPPGRRANRRIAEVLLQCQGGVNLTGVGLQRDIADAAEVDRYHFVPEFDAEGWRIYRP